MKAAVPLKPHDSMSLDLRREGEGVKPNEAKVHRLGVGVVGLADTRSLSKNLLIVRPVFLLLVQKSSFPNLPLFQSNSPSTGLKQRCCQ